MPKGKTTKDKISASVDKPDSEFLQAYALVDERKFSFFIAEAVSEYTAKLKQKLSPETLREIGERMKERAEESAAKAMKRGDEAEQIGDEIQAPGGGAGEKTS